MPSVKDLFPDRWLKAADLIRPDGSRPQIAVEIRAAGVEQRYSHQSKQKEPRLIVAFAGRNKELICNKTQALAIAEITRQEDYTKWRGAAIRIQAGTAHNGKPTILILAPVKTKTQAETNTNDHDPDHNQEQDPNQ